MDECFASVFTYMPGLKFIYPTRGNLKDTYLRILHNLVRCDGTGLSDLETLEVEVG